MEQPTIKTLGEYLTSNPKISIPYFQSNVPLATDHFDLLYKPTQNPHNFDDREDKLEVLLTIADKERIVDVFKQNHLNDSPIPKND